jgi:diguanylate cyclase (GGDEF)-like protein
MTENSPASVKPVMTLLHLYILPLSLLFISTLTFWDKFHRFTNILLSIAPVLAALGSLLIINKIDEFHIYLPEIYLIVIWTFSISGLRLTYALMSASTTFLMTSVAGYYFLFDNSLFLLHLLWLSSAFSFGLLNAFHIEKSHIQTFLKEQELEHIALFDKLTTLYNRSKIEAVVADEIDRAERYRRKMSVILVDIDRFKNVNDRYGHHVGDVVLKEFAFLLKEKLRKVDIVGRWGGEEFIIILPETDIKLAEKVAEQIRVGIEDFLFSVVKHKTASFGISEYIHGDSVKSLFIRVDKALYKAKENGRNQIQTL